MSDSVLLEKREHTLWITLNRPEKRNAINSEMVATIQDGWQQAQTDADIRLIVLTGVGDTFSSGIDLQSASAWLDPREPSNPYSDLLRQVQHADIPSIACINGLCLGAALSLLGMTDLAIAAEQAQFALPEVKRGLFPMPVLALLQTLVAPRTLREWCLTGETFSAEQALSSGLLNYVVPAEQLAEKTDWLINRLIDKSPSAQQRGKYAMRQMAEMSFEASLAFAESQLPLLAMTEDAREGIAAFIGKRKPIWRGR